MTFSLSLSQKSQLLTASVLRLINALRAEDFETRVVGGAVRDLLMNRPLGDIDLATTAPPDRAMDILAKHNIKTVPTGLAHGTITAVVDHIGYEITTLRRDVATDGRHAQVAYTDDWQTDAARRDFTFNALYADAEGTIYDYFNGAEDAKTGTVRFIGDAQTRIREDVLRILRFFRFYAWFGRDAPDAAALVACKTLSDLIPKLSAERVARETIKLLAAQNPLPSWQLMIDNGITKFFLAEATGTARLQTLLANEKKFGEIQSPLTRLAALIPTSEQTATAIAKRLKLSTHETEKLRVLASLLPALQAEPLRAILYRFGAENTRAAVFLNGEKIPTSLVLIDDWENPIFPIRGEDLLKLNISPGPRIGDILRATEHWWIESDFRPDRAACLEYAKKMQ